MHHRIRLTAISLLLIFCAFLFSTQTVHAEAKDNIEVSTSIVNGNVILSVKNSGSVGLEKVNITTQVPDSLDNNARQLSWHTDSIKPQETVQYTINKYATSTTATANNPIFNNSIVNKLLPKAGEHTTATLSIVGILLITLVLFVLSKNKHSKTKAGLWLLLLITGLGVAGGSAEATSRTTTDNFNPSINLNGKTVHFPTKITYMAGEQENTDISSTKVSSSMAMKDDEPLSSDSDTFNGNRSIASDGKIGMVTDNQIIAKDNTIGSQFSANGSIGSSSGDKNQLSSTMVTKDESIPFSSTLSNDSGVPLLSADLTITDLADQSKIKVTTDKDGYFFTRLLTGHRYSIVNNGFKGTFNVLSKDNVQISTTLGSATLGKTFSERDNTVSLLPSVHYLSSDKFELSIDEANNALKVRSANLDEQFYDNDIIFLPTGALVPYGAALVIENIKRTDANTVLLSVHQARASHYLSQMKTDAVRTLKGATFSPADGITVNQESSTNTRFNPQVQTATRLLETSKHPNDGLFKLNADKGGNLTLSLTHETKSGHKIIIGLKFNDCTTRIDSALDVHKLKNAKLEIKNTMDAKCTTKYEYNSTDTSEFSDSTDKKSDNQLDTDSESNKNPADFSESNKDEANGDATANSENPDKRKLAELDDLSLGKITIPMCELVTIEFDLKLHANVSGDVTLTLNKKMVTTAGIKNWEPQFDQTGQVSDELNANGDASTGIEGSVGLNVAPIEAYSKIASILPSLEPDDTRVIALGVEPKIVGNVNGRLKFNYDYDFAQTNKLKSLNTHGSEASGKLEFEVSTRLWSPFLSDFFADEPQISHDFYKQLIFSGTLPKPAKVLKPVSWNTTQENKLFAYMIHTVLQVANPADETMKTSSGTTYAENLKSVPSPLYADKIKDFDHLIFTPTLSSSLIGGLDKDGLEGWHIILHGLPIDGTVSSNASSSNLKDYHLVAGFGYRLGIWNMFMNYFFTIHNGKPVILYSEQNQGNEEKNFSMETLPANDPLSQTFTNLLEDPPLKKWAILDERPSAFENWQSFIFPHNVSLAS